MRPATSTATCAVAHQGRSRATTTPSKTAPAAHAAVAAATSSTPSQGGPGSSAAQRRGRPGHEHREDGPHARTERDGGREAAHHHPAGPPPGGGEPRHQRRAPVRPGHAGGDGDDGDHRHGRAEPVRGHGPGGEQPARQAAERPQRGRGGQHAAVTQRAPACRGDRAQARHRGRDRVVTGDARHGGHDACGVDRHGRRVRARVGPLRTPGRRRVGPRDRRPQHPHRRILR